MRDIKGIELTISKPPRRTLLRADVEDFEPDGHLLWRIFLALSRGHGLTEGGASTLFLSFVLSIFEARALQSLQLGKLHHIG